MKTTQWAGRAFLIGLFLILPFLSSTETVEHELAPRFLGISVLLGSCLTFLTFKSFGEKDSSNFLQTRLSLLWLGFILIGFISGCFALNPTEAYIENLKNIPAYFTAAVLFYLLRKQNSILNDIPFVICLFLCGILLIGGHQAFFERERFFEFKDLVSSLSNPNLFASMLVICLPFIYLLFRTNSSIWIKIPAGILGVITLLFIVFLKSKSALLALVVGLTLFGGLYCYRKGWLKTGNSIRNTLIVALIISFGIIGYYIFNTYMEKWADLILFDTAKAETFDGNIERIMLWKNSIKMFAEFPFLGVGPGHWKLYFPKYGISGWYLDKSLIQFSTPHNDYLWILCEYGLLGFGIYIALIFNILKGFWRQFKQSSGHSAWVYSALMCGFVAYLSDSLFSYPRERVMHLVLFAVYAAISSQQSPEHSFPKIFIRLFFPTALGISLFVTYTFYGRFIAEKHLENAREARKELRWEYSISEAEKSEKMRLFYTPFYLEPTALTQGMAYDELGQPLQAYACYERAYKAAPFHLYSMVQYAGALHAQGKNTEALDIIDRSLKITPGFWFSWRLKSLMLLKNNDIEGSWKALNSASFTIETEYNELAREIFKARLIRLYETLPEGDENLDCLKKILEKDKIPSFIDKKYNSSSDALLWTKENKEIICKSE